MKFKRILSILLTVCLLISVLPTVSLAAGNDDAPNGYHLATNFPKADGETYTGDLYLGAEVDGKFYALSGTSASSDGVRTYPTSTDATKQKQITLRYGGVDSDHGTYYYVTYWADKDIVINFAGTGASNGFSQNSVTGTWKTTQRMYFDQENGVLFTVYQSQKYIMIIDTANSNKIDDILLSDIGAENTVKVGLYEKCVSDNTPGSDATGAWDATCTTGNHKIGYRAKLEVDDPDKFHQHTALPTAENSEITGLTLGAALEANGDLYAVSGTSSGTPRTFPSSADISAQSTITLRYAGADGNGAAQYNIIFTSGASSYAMNYSSGVVGQNAIQSTGTPSGGFAAKHAFYYNAEGQFFYGSDTTYGDKGLAINTQTQRIETVSVADMQSDSDTYVPVRAFQACTSDDVAGEDDTHQWSGTCTVCDYKFDYKAKDQTEEVNINIPAEHHSFTALPTAENKKTTAKLYLGAALEAGGAFYGVSATSVADGSSRSFATSTVTAEQCTVTIHYGGNDATYGDYYYIEFTLPSGTSYGLNYASGAFGQNTIQDTGTPSGGWGDKHKMFYDATYQFFYHRPSNDMTVMKGLKLVAATQKISVETVENLKEESNTYAPVRLFEACTSDNVAGKNDTHHWSGTCACGNKLGYEPNYALLTRAPQANTAYFWGVTQEDMEGEPTYYFNGDKLSSSFGTQLDISSATNVYVDVVEGGYNLYFLNANSEKQYICLGKDAANSYKTYINVVTDVAAATVFTWNTEYNTFVTTVVKDAAGNTVDMVLGAYTSGGTAYYKISGLLLTHLAQEHYFASHLYVEHMSHAYDGWGYDEENHWKTCLCGKELAAEAHTLGEPVVENGKVYRKCECGYAKQDGAVPSVTDHAISLADNFAIHFFVEKAPFDSGLYAAPYMVFAMGGEETQVTDYKTQDGYYVFTFSDLAPDLMGETVTANLYATVAQEVALVSTDTYSVAQYCYEGLRNEGSGDILRKLLVETLNFGAAAQQYRGSSAALVNAQLTDEEKALGYTGDLRALQTCKDFGTYDASSHLVKWYGATLLMGDSIKLRVYFEADNITGLSIKAAGETVGEDTLTNIGTKDGKYYVDYAQVNPSKMGEEITFTAYKDAKAVSATMHYSLESYADTWVNRADAGAEQEALAKAVIRYGDAAKDYAQRAYDLQEDVLYLGRTYEMDDAQWFNWSASGFSVKFQGSGLKAKIASNAPNATNYAYLKVYVDGVEQQTDILLDKTMQTVTLAEGLDANEVHTVEVRKRTSPRSSTAGLLSLELLDGTKLAAPEAKDKLIEFVGDSLTVGYSAGHNALNESGWSTGTEDGTKTYSKRVADAFDAEYMVTAISGRGVVMNNNNADGYLLPDIYPELDIYNIPGTAYDFTLQPDVIVINLGTNDATNTNLNLDVFQAGVVSFIQTVRAKNPNAEIIWAYGLRQDNMTAEVAVAIEAAVAQINTAGDNNVHYLALDLVDKAYMDNSHPTADGYAPSANKLIEKISAITNW